MKDTADKRKIREWLSTIPFASRTGPMGLNFYEVRSGEHVGPKENEGWWGIAYGEKRTHTYRWPEDVPPTRENLMYARHFASSVPYRRGDRARTDQIKRVVKIVRRAKA